MAIRIRRSRRERASSASCLSGLRLNPPTPQACDQQGDRGDGEAAEEGELRPGSEELVEPDRGPAERGVGMPERERAEEREEVVDP